MRPLALVGLWLALVALACGCQYTQLCYENMGIINPASRAVLIFNKCDGSMSIDYVPEFGPPPAPTAEKQDQNIPTFDPNPKVES